MSDGEVVMVVFLGLFVLIGFMWWVGVRNDK